ncbi:hypothetical protein [Myroides fluvii]|uniref:hypothetical protein n=1 Tax=Myroides fluvii TaxID=2572594 RepID=UPI0018EED561|nr:hypothetical protein [Myroides fluvii]
MQESTTEESKTKANITEANTTQENITEGVKMYSSNAIAMATFLGGPLVAGYLIRENYRALGEEKKAKQAWILGIIATVVIFGGLLLLSDTIVERIPNYIFPAIFAGIVSWIVEVKQGDKLRQHKAFNNVFYSGWRSAGLALVSALIVVICIVGVVFLMPEDKVYEQYQTEFVQFSENEEETLKFYDNITTKSQAELLQDLDQVILPKWEENIEIIKKTNQIENLPAELVKQNENLLVYSEFRLIAFTIWRRAIAEDTDQYTAELEEIHTAIEKQLDKLR